MAYNLGFWQELLLPISLYVILGPGRTVILEGVSSAYHSLCSPQSGPHAIWDMRFIHLGDCILEVRLLLSFEIGFNDIA